MKRIWRLLHRFFCGLTDHGDSETLTISEDAYTITLWECIDCGTQRWKHERRLQ